MDPSEAPPQIEAVAVKEQKYICVARTSTPKSNGSILRNIRSCDSIYLPDHYFPLGTVVWEYYDSKSSTKQWRYRADSRVYTVRFQPFAFPYFIDRNDQTVKEFKVGDTFWTQYMGIIGVLYNGPNPGYCYLTPRELIDTQYLSMFNNEINWFVSDCQSDEDSVPYTPRDYLNDYKSRLPEFDKHEPQVQSSLCLCSHRDDYLSFFDGVAPTEKIKKKRFAFEKGRWYFAQFNPAFGVRKLCSIRPVLNGSPVETWVSPDNEIVLLRDYVPTPSIENNPKVIGDTYVSYHPLLYRIHFPRSCLLFQSDAVEVCFCRQSYRLGEDNQWIVVAVNSGFGMVWLDEIPSQIAKYLKKEDFPFIKTHDFVEAAHLQKFYPNASLDHYMRNHANIFMKYSEWNKEKQLKDEKAENQDSLKEDVAVIAEHIENIPAHLRDFFDETEDTWADCDEDMG